MRELTEEDLKYLSLFERVTGIFPSDYLLIGESLAFLVDEGELGQAIGKNGKNVQQLKSMLRKKVLVIAGNGDASEMAKKFFSNVRVLDISYQPNAGLLIVSLDDRDRGIAIGKDGERIKIAKEIFMRKFNLQVELKTRRVL